MNSHLKLVALGCALGIAGCTQGSLSGAVPATSAMGAAPGRIAASRLGVRPLNGSGDPLLYDFQGDPDGSTPYGALADVGGVLYGTTYQGGTNNLGSIFSVTTGGSELVVHSFSGGDGEYPLAGLINVNGTLYGAAPEGTGSAGYGDVFSYDPASNTFQVIYRFQDAPTDGQVPVCDLTYVNGALYGTTEEGGNAGGWGTVFKLIISGSKSGQESIVYNFQGTIDGGPDGARPEAGVLYHDGLLYGTTYAGGAKGEGTLFSISLATGKETILHTFGSKKKDGDAPQADLLFYKNKLYGTASTGGIVGGDCGGLGCGTVFQSTLAGTYKTLYPFDPNASRADGLRPLAGLIDVDGTFYGTTADSAPEGYGTVFSVTPAGTEHVLVTVGFGPPPWPKSPAGALIDVGGVLYGTSLQTTTPSGGDGTVYALPI